MSSVEQIDREEQRVRDLVIAIQAALADEIYWQLGEHSGLCDDLWLMDDDSVQWRDPTWQVPEDAVIRIWAELNVEDLLGPYWPEGLPLDSDGEPIVTRELAEEWAEWWAMNNAAELVYDTLDAVEQQEAQEAEERRFWEDLRGK